MPPGSGDNSQQHWVATLQTIFAVLTGHFVLAPTTQAGTHVHVSCEPAVLATNGAGALAAVAKAALYFEPALDALMPASRSSGGKDGGGSPYWCQSNRASVALKGLSGGLESCFALLDECYAAGAGGAEPIVRAMCLFPASSAYGRAHGYKADFVHGVYKWDFSGLLPDTGSGTLEYRQVSENIGPCPTYAPPSRIVPAATSWYQCPKLHMLTRPRTNQCPGSRTADEARAWVELGLCFVAGAIDTGHTLDPLAQQHRQQVCEGGNLMEDLWWMLCAGAQAAGVGELEGIRAMDFTGGSGGGAKGVKAKNEKK